MIASRTTRLFRPRAHRHAGPSFYGRWVGACTAGELVGIGTATGAALAVNAWIGEPASTIGRLAVLGIFAAVGFVEGGALAFLQWRVLRSPLPRLRAGEWLAPTIAIAVAGWLIGMTPSLFFAGMPDTSAAVAPVEPPLSAVLALAALAGAAAGLCFGAAQWFVLRRHAERSQDWIWIHVPAWALALAAIFLGATVPSSDWPPWGIAVLGVAGGVLGGLLLGAVTGIVALRLTPWVDERRWSLRGKVCAVTGANAGIGREVAMGLVRLGGTVLLLCRRPTEGERLRQTILARHPGARAEVVPCDMSDFESIRRAAARILRDTARLDVLVHNAGATFPQRTITSGGVEATLAVDAVGPFLLTTLLRERLESARGRVIALTGIYHRKGHMDIADLHFAHRAYDWLAANNQAQLARWLVTSELARRAPRLTAVSVHPGAVLTAAQTRLPRVTRVLLHTLARPVFVRAEVGAIPVLRLTAQRDLEQATGRFFNRCEPAPDVADPALARRFWDVCEQMTGERWPVDPPSGAARGNGIVSQQMVAGATPLHDRLSTSARPR